LTAPLPQQQYPRRQEFTYALIDTDTGRMIAQCDGAGTAAKAGDITLPSPTDPLAGQPSVTAAWAAGPAGGRVASWLPFTAAAALGTAFPLPGGGRELIADYFAAEAEREGERIQIVSTAHAPILRLGADGGEPIALGDGHPARLDLLGAMSVLTWQEGDLWYQIVAVRPQGRGAPFRPDELLRIAAGLRSRER
jgi:hypothetical protein